MDHLTINNDKEPIRLFKSDFLETFTHISPIAVSILWIPIILFFTARSFGWQAVSLRPGLVILAIAIGMFVWTLSEYLLHRFLFHMPAKGKAMERITFLFHGVHHAQPQCKTRLVMPPAVSLPLAAIFYGLFVLVIQYLMGGAGWVAPLFTGFGIGYLTYDLTHYATHHFPMRDGYLKYIKRYHMQHHYKTPNQRFGVTSPAWDWVFGTLPPDTDY
jgi:sterol desaturase/sphingolipid hydroxylase (fatty acid hydroxylase superfamily)